MTPAETSCHMILAEVTAENLKAAQIMGWEEVEFAHGRHIVLPNFWKGPFGAIYYRLRNYGEIFSFSPCTSPADAHRLLMRMVELGWDYSFRGLTPDKKHRASFSKDSFVGNGRESTLELAITFAANAGFRAEKE